MNVPAPKPVYIVDDDPLIRRSIHIWLSDRGYQPRSFSGAVDFIEELPNLRPGCALIDVRMPELDGIALVRRHSTALRHLVIIMMTGHGDIEMAVEAMKLGAVDFIEKPFTVEPLLRSLNVANDRLSQRVETVQKSDSAANLIGTLTTREADILRGLLSGHSNKSLAHNLSLSPRTVEMHRSNVMKKLQTRSLSETLKLALDAGFAQGNSSQSIG